jgi:4-amino-4-deoxyprephenate dehydrogenase
MQVFRHAVVAGGSGAVGRMFVRVLAGAGTEVVCVDRVPPTDGTAFVEGDIRSPGTAVAAALARTDLVLLAVPEPVALAAVAPIAAHLAPGALLVDTLSVKSRIAAEVARHVAGAAMSLNPMFAPSLGLDGRVVASVTITDGPPVAAMRSLLTAAGATVVELTADEHDRISAVSQAATHAAVLAFGLAAASLGIDVAALRSVAPPPHETLLALAARITGGEPEVYWDVQDANPYAGAAREALGAAAERIRDIDSEPAFRSVLSEVRAFLGDDRADLAAVCARMFGTLRRSGPGGPEVDGSAPSRRGSGDIEAGAIEAGDAEPGDAEPAHVEPGAIEPGDVAIR